LTCRRAVKAGPREQNSKACRSLSSVLQIDSRLRGSIRANEGTESAKRLDVVDDLDDARAKDELPSKPEGAWRLWAKDV
jgi:hypothetical protein